MRSLHATLIQTLQEYVRGARLSDHLWGPHSRIGRAGRFADSLTVPEPGVSEDEFIQVPDWAQRLLWAEQVAQGLEFIHACMEMGSDHGGQGFGLYEYASPIMSPNVLCEENTLRAKASPTQPKP